MSDPRILTIDIETAPAAAYVWRTFKENIGPSQVIVPTRMLCFGAKWHDYPGVMYSGEFQHGHDNMVKAAWNLLDEADIVVHYNGERFDIPHLRREFLLSGLRPPTPFQQVDLLKTVRREFRFLSGRLQQVSMELGLPGKIETTFTLWERCMRNDPEAWEEMKAYVMQDVRDEELVYDRLRPWIQGHPNMNLYVDHDAANPVCPNCGSDNLQRRGYATTQVSKFRRYHCQNCGKWSRGGRSVEREDVRSFVGS